MTKFTPGNTRAARISNEQVLELRRLYFDENWSQARLARHYQVNVNTIGRIVRGESRQRVPMPSAKPEEIAERLLALQRQHDQEVLERLNQAIAKEPATLAKEAETSLMDWAAADKYGARK